MRILTGQCGCRAVTYEVADEFTYALNCHCSNCRRMTGAAYKPLAGIEISKINISDGLEDTISYGDSDSESFHCRKCSSLLYVAVRGRTYAHVLMGTLVDTPSIRPDRHIFVGSKAAWFEITDDLPQFDEFG